MVHGHLVDCACCTPRSHAIAPATEHPYIFLSYASADRQRALAIVDSLKSAGVRVWMDQRAINGGASWDAAIVRAIKGCTALILAATETSVRSRNVQTEVRLAMQYGRPLLPLLVSPATFPEELEYALVGVQWVEVLDHSPEVWLPRVLRALAQLDLSTELPFPQHTSIPPVPLVDWQQTDVIRRGDQRNQIGLRCVGETITAMINGVDVASAHDNGHFTGRGFFGVVLEGNFQGVVEGYFDNFVIARP